MKSALVVGHTGQDGTYLSDRLKDCRYQVFGVSNKIVDDAINSTHGHVDLTDKGVVDSLLKFYRPDEIYYLAAVHQSSEDSVEDEYSLFHASIDINLKMLVNLLDSIKNYSPESKMFYASSSHVFGEPKCQTQDESTEINPTCIYGITKAAGMHACRFYRNRYSLFVSIGILYNHISPIQQQKFVSQKIVHGVVDIYQGRQKSLVVGDLETEVDWGHAEDYVKAMQNILEHNSAEDFVISSGHLHSIEEFLSCAFGYLHMDWKRYVNVDRSLIAKRKKANLFGNNGKIVRTLDWQPEKTFELTIKEMIDFRLKRSAPVIQDKSK